MAKKYRAVESKIHWLTWVIMATLVTAMIVLFNVIFLALFLIRYQILYL